MPFKEKKLENWAAKLKTKKIKKEEKKKKKNK